MSAEFWAGYISGAASIAVGNPLDILKVRLQASRGTSSLASFKTVSELVAGLPAPVLTYGALNAILFWSYTQTLSRLPSSQGAGDTDRISPPWAHFTAGAIAGLATFVVSAPTELVKCRAQVGSSDMLKQDRTSWGIAREIYARHGLRGLYFGGVVTSLRDSIGYGFYFWTYEISSAAWVTNVSPVLREKQMWMGEDKMRILLCGGLAGVATWLSIFPLDVVKSRMQTQSFTSVPSEHSPLLSSTSVEPIHRSAVAVSTGICSANVGQRKTSVRADGAIKIAAQMWRNEGKSAFFRGLTVCSVRAFIVNAVQWTTYEWARKLF